MSDEEKSAMQIKSPSSAMHDLGAAEAAAQQRATAARSDKPAPRKTDERGYVQRGD